MDAEFVKILCCPETRQDLALADTPLLEQVNHRIAAGEVRNRGGEVVREKIDGGLVRADGKFLYPIRGRLPFLLVDEAIPLTSAA